MPKIVTLTLNPAVDTSSKVARVTAERKLRCEEPDYHPGGGGINVARVIHELGGEAAAYWTCGGPLGEFLSQLLDDEGIQHHPIPIRATTRENVTVFEESSGQQFRFVMPGSALTEEEVQSCLDQLQGIDPPPEYLVLSGSLPAGVDHGLYGRIARSMASSCRVVLDTSGRPLQLAVESMIYLIKPNIAELEQLAGQPIEDDAQLHEVARSLVQEDRAEVVVTSLGSGGVVLTTAEGHRHIPAPTVKIRSKVGAGDSTVAGIVMALAEGKSILDAVCFGVAAGAAAVMTEGTELCRRKDAERLYQTISQMTTS